MTSCARFNNTALQCNNGCCGTTVNQKCCSGFELSETVLIVCCVGGAVIVFTLVILLVLCITKKKKNAVIRIEPRRRQRQSHHNGGERSRRPIAELPKPPPYSEAPPEYNSWNATSTDTAGPSSRAATEYDPVVPAGSNQVRNYTSTHEGTTHSRSSHVRTSPHPSTSASRAMTAVSNNRIQSQSGIILETSHLDEISRHDNHSRNQTVSRHTRDEDYSYVARNRQIATSSHDDMGHVHRTINHRSTAPVMTNLRPGHAQEHTETEMNSVDLPGEIISIPESPPPINQAAALRSAKRRAVLTKLESRRRINTDMSSSGEQ